MFWRQGGALRREGPLAGNTAGRKIDPHNDQNENLERDDHWVNLGIPTGHPALDHRIGQRHAVSDNSGAGFLCQGQACGVEREGLQRRVPVIPGSSAMTRQQVDRKMPKTGHKELTVPGQFEGEGWDLAVISATSSKCFGHHANAARCSLGRRTTSERCRRGKTSTHAPCMSSTR